MAMTPLTRMAKHRRILLLQGPAGGFFKHLSHHLERQGALVSKVNLNAGDWLFYPDARYNYTGAFEAWPLWLTGLLQREPFDAIVLFGDCRKYHQVAVQECKRRGLPVYVFEEGYFRPDYVTLETGGVNGYSAVPRDEAFYRQEPATYPTPEPRAVSFTRLAITAYVYYLGCAWGRVFFPRFESHRPLPPSLEQFAWLRGGAYTLMGRLARVGQSVLTRCQGEWAKRYFLVTLQLKHDAQVRHHADGSTVPGFMAQVISSFAEHAPPDTQLVIKLHPQDVGFVSYRGLVKELARQHGVPSRVHYLTIGHMPTLLKAAAGVVTLNSTTGLSALHHGTPVKALAPSPYNFAGLTSQAPLSAFWGQPGSVDETLYSRYRSYVVRTAQINGSFYGCAKSCRAFLEAASGRSAEKKVPSAPQVSR